ncbi:glycine zipper 2TM domain-containing protein [Flavitalea flava]
MKLVLYVLTLSTIFLGCNSNPANSVAGKKDTVVIKDTVIVLSKHSTSHVASRGKQDNQNTPSNEPANNASNSPIANQPATNVSQQENPPKKGWSAAAKDATIGGAAGAAAGALLDKNNRWVGGGIGAALGAGAGYLIGRARDRKTGRVVKHKPSDTNYNYANQQ